MNNLRKRKVTKQKWLGIWSLKIIFPIQQAMLSFIAKTSRIRVLVLHTIYPDSFHFPFSNQKHFAETSSAVIWKAFLFFSWTNNAQESNCQGKDPNKPHQWTWSYDFSSSIPFSVQRRMKCTCKELEKPNSTEMQWEYIIWTLWKL